MYALVAAVTDYDCLSRSHQGQYQYHQLVPAVIQVCSPTTVEGDKRGLYSISRDVMSSEPAAGDKRSELDASDTDDDDGCGEQGEELGQRVPNLSKLGRGTRN